MRESLGSRALYRKMSKALGKKGFYLIRSLLYKAGPQRIPANLDYVRIATLGLCVEEIEDKQLEGAVAELGVYRGDFAAKLNLGFPGRRLYLFDTFTGFADHDGAIDRKKGYSTGLQDFSKTSQDLVKAKMPYPEQCLFRAGMFPETAVDLEERFVFVSLDVDLYQPTLEGLRFFYPRLKPGGFIFVHDYNNKEYPGVKAAVNEFCQTLPVTPLPLPDIGGTVVLTK